MDLNFGIHQHIPDTLPEDIQLAIAQQYFDKITEFMNSCDIFIDDPRIQNNNNLISGAKPLDLPDVLLTYVGPQINLKPQQGE